MPRTRYSEYSATPGDNTDIDGINIGEGMAPSDVNNSLRAFLSQTRDFIDGSSGDTLTSSNIVVTTATILSGVNVTGTATFNSAVILSSSVTGSALSLSGALTVGGATILSSSLGVTGTASMGVIDATTLEVTNLKAKDSTASATIADATGVMTVASAVLTTADINGGTLDNTVIGGATPAAGTFTTGSATTFTATTVDSTNLEVTNLKAKDGTSAGSIADSTGVVTLASAVLTTAEINGGTADNVVIGGVTAAAGTFTTATATTGNITNVNATTVDSTNLAVTNIKAKDGTAAATIADSTGVVTIPSAVLTTADINGGTVDNAAVGAGTPSTGAFTTLSSNSTTILNGTTIPASKTLLVSTDIGVTVQGYDADTAKYDDVTANFSGTLQNGGSNVLVDTDIGVNVQAYDAQLADVAGLTPADGSFIVGNGTNFITEDGATARTSLGLGSISTQAADNVDIDGGAVDGVTLGTNAAVTEAQIDNVNINGNAIVSSDTDGDLSLTPNGTGDLILDGLKWPQADGTADYVLKTDGSGQLAWTAQSGGGGSGTVTSVDVSGGTTGLTTSGGPVTTSGTITLAGTLAAANGGTGQTTFTDGEILIGKTDGSLAKATLTAGSNITITNGDGAITIASSAAAQEVVTPTNVSPADLATDIGETPTLTGSTYYSLYGKTQKSSQWQVSTDNTFATTDYDSGEVLGVGVTHAVPASNLSVSTTYYWRVRYRDSDDTYSEYSTPTEFETAASFNNFIATPTATPAIGGALEGGFHTGLIWNQVTQSATSTTIGTGSKTFTVTDSAPLFYSGQAVEVRSRANPATARMIGTVTGSSGTTLTVNVTSVDGSGTLTDWSIMAKFRVIVAPKSSGENSAKAYKNSNDGTIAAAGTLTEGLKATLAMVADGNSTVYPAAHYCNDLSIGGYSDWYLPARDELELIWRNLKTSTDTNASTSARVNSPTPNYTNLGSIGTGGTDHGLNYNSDPQGVGYTSGSPAQTSVVAFQSGGAEALVSNGNFYRSSTEYSTVYAWSQRYNSVNAGMQDAVVFGKAVEGYVRAVRRSII
jgi:hypothetical protein